MQQLARAGAISTFVLRLNATAVGPFAGMLVPPPHTHTTTTTHPSLTSTGQVSLAVAAAYVTITTVITRNEYD